MASLIFSTLTSLKPLTLSRFLRVAAWTDCPQTLSVRYSQALVLDKVDTNSNSVKPIRFKLRNVCGANAYDLQWIYRRQRLGAVLTMSLDVINVYDERLAMSVSSASMYINALQWW